MDELDRPPAAAPRPFVAVVSGLPRSGTSMMMRMLEAGGLPAVTDARRTADEDNPHGYFELEAVKQMTAGAADFLGDAQGKALKVIHLLLARLPASHAYRVVFMHRDLDEVLASQQTMLERGGRPGGGLPAETMRATFAKQVSDALATARARPEMRVLEVQHRRTLTDPSAVAAEVSVFLGGGLDEAAMAAAVDPALHRNRV